MSYFLYGPNHGPSKHFNVVSTYSFHWKDVGTCDNVKSTLKQRCVFQHGIYNVEKRRINVVYYNVDINNVRQCENNVIFNVEFSTKLVNVETTLLKWLYLKRTKKIISNRIHEIWGFNNYFMKFFPLLLMLRGICYRVLAKPRKLLKDHEKYCVAKS